MINGGHFTKELQTVKTAVILVSHSWTVFLLDLLFLLPLSVASFLKLPMFFAAPFLLPAIGWFGAKLVLWWQIYEGHSISKNLLMKLWLYYFKELLYPYWWVTILELPILMVQLWIVFLSSLL